jgi:hypothetical protein
MSPKAPAGSRPSGAASSCPGRFAPASPGFATSLIQGLDLDRDLCAVAFNACFLRHAANELQRSSAEGRAFLDLADRAAALSMGPGWS